MVTAIEVGDLVIERKNPSRDRDQCVKVVRVDGDGMLWVNDLGHAGDPYRIRADLWEVWKSVGEQVARELMGVDLTEEA